jgi:hypothetical protein
VESTALLWLQRGFLFIVTVVAGWVIYELIVLEIHNRARTADGLLGDPVNLAVIGTMAELRSLMLAAGWSEPDPVTPRSSWRIIEASLLPRSYPSAPVSALFVFQRKQTMAFEREVDGSPAQRHHVRFWVCPDGWKLPGGFDVDLIGAATFDRRVGLSLLTFNRRSPGPSSCPPA